MSGSTTSDVASVLAAGLRRHGVTTVFGQSLPSWLMLAIEAAGIRHLTYRTENAGGAMADGFARASGRIGVVAAQNGPAATLLVPPLAEATAASIPLLALVQDVPAASLDRNAFQEYDHRALFAGCAKWVRRVDDPNRVEDYLDLAITTATTGRPGPAVLLLPKDVLAARTAPPSRRTALGHYPLDPSRPAAAPVERAAELLCGARAPVVIAGGGVHASQAAASLAALQELASLPVATTTMGKGAVDEAHPLSIGVVGSYMAPRSATHHLRDLVADADVVLLVGTRTNENGTDGWRLLPREATLIHLDIDGLEVGRTYEAERLVGDARLGLDDLAAAVGRRDLSRRRVARADVEERIRRGRAAHRAEVEAVTRSDATPIRPERVMGELDALLDDQMIVVADASYSTIWVGNYLRGRRAGQRFLTPRGLAGLGWGLPMALGAQAAHPDRRVVCLSGDGGFGHVWSELETAARERLPVTAIVLANGVLGFQKHSELVQFGAHTHAVDLAPVDHAAIARACGVHAERVERPDDLAGALRTAIELDAPALIEVIADPDAYPPITSWTGTIEQVVPAAALSQEARSAPR